MTNLLGQLKRLIDEADSLISQSRMYTADDGERAQKSRKVVRWMTNCESILNFASLPNYLGKFQEAVRATSYEYQRIARISGILESARDMLAGGFVGNLRSTVQAEILDSVIDQAELLYRSGQLLAAAVLGRIVLERWLRDRATQNGIGEADTAKVSMLNDKLKQAGVFSTPKWRQIQAGLDVGNSAAHGKTEEFSKEDVDRLLVFVRSVAS